MAVISLIGMYNYDNSLFDGLLTNLPTPLDITDNYEMRKGWTLDGQIFVDNLLMECAELEVIYPNYDFLKYAITQWGVTNRFVWQELYNTLFYKYNPIWNKDGTSETEDTETRELNATNNETRNLRLDYTENGESIQKPDLETNNTRKVSAFNSVDMENAESIREERTGTNSVESMNTGESANTGTVNRNMTDAGTIKKELKTLEYGNIGVTTTQSMIKEQREIVQFNIYKTIIDDFKCRFCLLIY